MPIAIAIRTVQVAAETDCWCFLSTHPFGQPQKRQSSATVELRRKYCEELSHCECAGTCTPTYIGLNMHVPCSCTCSWTCSCTWRTLRVRHRDRVTVTRRPWAFGQHQPAAATNPRSPTCSTICRRRSSVIAALTEADLYRKRKRHELGLVQPVDCAFQLLWMKVLA